MKKLTKIISTLFFLITSFFFNAQNRIDFYSLASTDSGFFYKNKVFTGVAFTNNKSGQLQREMDILDGKIIKNRNYYTNLSDSIPKIKFESETKDGKRNGLRRGWYESGEIKFETYYKNGWNNGSSIKWYKNGQKEKELQFKLGVKVGVHKDWNPSGILVKERYYQQTTPTSSTLIKRITYDKLNGLIITEECFDSEGIVVDCSK